MSPRAPVLALKDVRLADGPRMLFDGVDLALEPGVRACLVGRNGAGKSTLLRMLAGADRAGRRRAHADARPRASAWWRRSRTIAGDEPARLRHRRRRAGARGRGGAAGASASIRRAATQGLSGGESRRAALARAFAEQPDVLLLDEPTNHLDIFAIETLEAMLAASRAGGADRQPRPRLPGPRHPALLLAGGPADLAAGQGLRRLRRLVEPDRRRPGRVAAPAGQGDRARDLHRSTARSPPSAPATRAARGSWRRMREQQGRADARPARLAARWRPRRAAPPASGWSRPRASPRPSAGAC